MPTIQLVGICLLVLGVFPATVGSIIQNSPLGTLQFAGDSLRIASMWIMLLGALLIFAALVRSRRFPPIPLSIQVRGERQWISPVLVEDYLRLHNNPSSLGQLLRLRRRQRHRLRIVDARDCHLQLEHAQHLALIPKLAILDLQRCRLDQDDAFSFEEIKTLQLVLIHGSSLESWGDTTLKGLFRDATVCRVPSNLGLLDVRIDDQALDRMAAALVQNAPQDASANRSVVA